MCRHGFSLFNVVSENSIYTLIRGAEYVKTRYILTMRGKLNKRVASEVRKMKKTSNYIKKRRIAQKKKD